MKNASQTIILQCMRPECRFRFHADGKSLTERCPKCGGPLTQAVFPVHKALPAAGGAALERPIEVLADNIRSAYNVGSILRTCDAAGVRHIHFSGITPTPDHPKVLKTALVGEHSLPWTQHWNALDAVTEAIRQEMQVITLENIPSAVSIFDLTGAMLHFPMLFVLGNELTGVDPGILQHSDLVIRIPMFGTKGSLNVATAFGIAVYFLRRHDL